MYFSFFILFFLFYFPFYLLTFFQIEFMLVNGNVARHQQSLTMCKYFYILLY